MEFLFYFILYLALFYFAVKFIWRRYRVPILKYISKKFQHNIHKRFQQEFHQKYTDQVNSILHAKQKKYTSKSRKKVGEYIDFEELE